MKIENIIEDIISDMRELSILVEDVLKKEYPFVDISVFLPGLEKLSTIKVIELWVREKEKTYQYGAEVHTHNGNRVFEKTHSDIAGETPQGDFIHNKLYGRFVVTLRVIIKKKKSKSKLKLHLHYC